MITYILATHNHHKAEEFRSLLSGIQIKTLDDIGFTKDIVEDGSSFEENAKIKSSTIKAMGYDYVISDDSGLEVEYLDGAPGIYSARYAGVHGDHGANMDKLLSELTGVESRGAQFRAVLSVWQKEEHRFFEGIVRGRIADKRLGTGGFGYDPIFIPEGYTDSFGQLSASVKNSFSHRARAVDALDKYLRK